MVTFPFHCFNISRLVASSVNPISFICWSSLAYFSFGSCSGSVELNVMFRRTYAAGVVDAPAAPGAPKAPKPGNAPIPGAPAPAPAPAPPIEALKFIKFCIV